MSNISELANAPELSFINNMTLQETEELVRENFVRAYREITGRDPEMSEASIAYLIAKAFCAVEYQTMQYVDAKGRAELLKTSTGNALDGLANLLGLTRTPPNKATAMQRFTVSEAMGFVVAIPAGTRVKTQDGKYFATLEYAEIKAGETSTETMIEAEVAGTDSDEIMAGTINILVDPIPYVASTSNTTPSTGGLDTEDDDSLTRRIFLAPSVYSSAGPGDAYEFYARSWRSDVADVRIDNPSPCKVDIYFVIQDENELRLPNTTELEAMEAYMSADKIRPMCDIVECIAPAEVEYTIDLTYWIAASDQKSAKEIQERIAAAVSDFETWQRKLGRDINPTELIARLREAGAKRVKLTAPEDITVGKTKLPKVTSTTVTYGGLEDD